VIDRPTDLIDRPTSLIDLDRSIDAVVVIRVSSGS